MILKPFVLVEFLDLVNQIKSCFSFQPLELVLYDTNSSLEVRSSTCQIKIGIPPNSSL